MAKRYIDADKVDTVICTLIEIESHQSHRVTLLRAKHAIESIPTADVVEVVRCKDCNWYIQKDNLCNYSDGLVCITDAEIDYCSYGKRREGMNYSCGNCKYCDHDKRYVYPFHCLKDKSRYDEEELNKRIQEGYKCEHFVFGFEGEEDE